MNNLFIAINELPNEIKIVIKEYIPQTTLIFVNKTNYLLYHFLLHLLTCKKL